MTFNRGNLLDLAATIDLDTNAFEQCLSAGTHQADVEKARRAAAGRGVNSTPTFFVNNQRVRGNVSFEDFQKIINQELAIAQ